jgi:hypothetical protein
MQALAIVTLTLTGLGGVLFGSDYLDRRILSRSSDVAAGQVRNQGSPDRPVPDRGAAVARPATGCPHWRERNRGRGRPALGRAGGLHGPLTVAARPRGGERRTPAQAP